MAQPCSEGNLGYRTFQINLSSSALVFSTVEFIFWFLPLSLLVFSLAKSKVSKYFIISVVSLTFIALGDVTSAIILLLAIPTALFLIYRKLNKFAILVLAPLLIFKYNSGFGFFPENPFAGLLLPLGISFFSFQLYSLVRDGAFEREVPFSLTILFKVSAYALFFPQLIAGPILRFKEFKDQRLERIKWNLGSKLFCFGLFKKVFLADNLAVVADRVYGTDVSVLSMPVMWLGAVAYHFQIYFDFCGYSEMAIGLALLFGVRLPRNFKFPYSASSMTDFWRRWHITLSRFFRDYLYIPLGGNRRGKWFTYRNLIIVFLITGAWHGSTANFIIWGMLHGLMLIIERLASRAKIIRGISNNKVLGLLYVNFAACMFWVPFRSHNLEDTLARLQLMFSPVQLARIHQIFDFTYPLHAVVLIIAILFSGRAWFNFIGVKGSIFTWRSSVSALAAFSISVLFIVAGSYSPFIYFRF